MELYTKRLILRAWRESDAPDLYNSAKNPNVGPAAGWNVHTDVNDSLNIIKNVLSAKNTFAVVLKSENRAVGSIGLMVGKSSNLMLNEDEGEIGFWLDESYWGQGLIPEAVSVILEYGFNTLKLKNIWSAYFDGNTKSKRVQEKCGFLYDHTNKDILWKITNEIKTEHVTLLTKQHWESLTKGI